MAAVILRSSWKCLCKSRFVMILEFLSLDVVQFSLSPSLTGSDGSGPLPATPAMITPDVVASMGDHDSSIPTLNTAVMMYHLQQYADAMSVLEPLYSNVEPIDEACSNLLWSLCACSGSYLSTFPMLCNILTGIAALQVCLLMLDITLASHQPGKAAEVLQYMQKTFGYFLSPAESGNPAPVKEQLATPAETESLLNSTEPILTRTFSEEALEEEAFSLECCILALEKGLLAKSLPKREDVKVMVIVEGNWRVFVPTRSLNPTVASAKLGLQGDDDAVEDMELLIPQEDGKWFVADKLYELSLNFAIQCLRTAICLIDQREAIPAEVVTAAAAEEVKDNDGMKLKGSSHPFLLS
ncbi:unnamed protein product [Sphagnum jensenii]|uniref:Uncharacterized protein n=1 Tax=Sphagnum jensenii TaxID=128206 RepID=A0ABP1C1W0_9BRYO